MVAFYVRYLLAGGKRTLSRSSVGWLGTTSITKTNSRQRIGGSTPTRGLWADPAPIPPWDFRRGKRLVVEEGERGVGGVSMPMPTPVTAMRAEGQAPGPIEPEEETVYVTRIGAKYTGLVANTYAAAGYRSL
jgi:hypothetical protein